MENQTIIQVNANTWRIEDGEVRFFVLEGEKEALLIDTGLNSPNARELAESITPKPLKLLNTHADPDHISGNAAFDEFYMHPDECGNYLAHGGQGSIVPAVEGDIIDLGGRPLKIIELKGHTPGSIAVLDVNARVLISGDPIQTRRIYMFGKRRNMPQYIDSLKALWEKHREEFDLIYTSHGLFPVTPDIIPRLISAAESILAGNETAVKVKVRDIPVLFYDFGFSGFLCDIQ